MLFAKVCDIYIDYTGTNRVIIMGIAIRSHIAAFDGKNSL